jgi:glycosyltransferase involved in cell wall biosynthesis
MSSPLLSAILPHHEPSRAQLCQKTVNNFIRQHYIPYELVIVNSTGTPIITNEEINSEAYQAEGCFVKEIFVKQSKNAATMRNHGIRSARGDWIVSIDDDDWFHPARFLYQMARRREGLPCLLQHQLKVDISPVSEIMKSADPQESFTPLLHVDSLEHGLANTMLFPRIKSFSSEQENTLWLYDETLNTGEHLELLGRIAVSTGKSPVVCNNRNTRLLPTASLPLLSIAMYHGNNELDFNHFFGTLPPLQDRTVLPQELNAQDINLLKDVLRSYNFSIA